MAQCSKCGETFYRDGSRPGGARARTATLCNGCRAEKSLLARDENSFTTAYEMLARLLDEGKPRVLPESWQFVD